MQKEAKARIRINELLQRSGWRFFADDQREGDLSGRKVLLLLKRVCVPKPLEETEA